MAEVLTVADARQLYSGCLLRYKKDVVYVQSISTEYKASIYSLSENKIKTVPFNTDHFKPIGDRLGFVNINCCAMFVFRKPVRLFSMGLTANNLGMTYSRDCVMGGNTIAVSQRIEQLYIPELASTIKGEYPSFEEAYHLAREFEGSYAFDRQFAIDYSRNIFYKDNFVGRASGKTIDKIVFAEKFKYLNLLIGNTHEKNPRDFRPS